MVAMEKCCSCGHGEMLWLWPWGDDDGGGHGVCFGRLSSFGIQQPCTSCFTICIGEVG